MKNLWIGLIVAMAALIVCGCAMAETTGTCGEDLKWTLTDDGVLTISGTGSMPDYDTVLLKSNDLITTAPWGAAMDRVVIEEGVTSIGSSAFHGCSSLTGIIIPDSVTSIGGSAFNGCSSLTNITIPDSVTVIGKAAFLGCSSLTVVKIPAGVTHIESQTFEGCEKMISVDIPDGVTSIGYNAFGGCISLASVTIPDSVTDTEGAFEFCKNLKEIHVSDTHSTLAKKEGVLFSKDGSVLVLFPAGSTIAAYTIPEGVTRIASDAFSNCKSLNSIRLPDTVQEIGSGAFSGCSGLSVIVIPKSVTGIGYAAFEDCSSLPEIVIPEGVTGIGSSTFWNCSSLTDFTIPPAVTEISQFAFYGCKALEHITIPYGVTKIEDDAFKYCSALRTVDYTGSIEQWNDIAIGTGNKCLTDANIVCSNNGGVAFIASGRRSLDISWTLDEAGTLTIRGSGRMYSFGQSWDEHSSLIKNVVIKDGITDIDKGAFANCGSLVSVIIPDSVTEIGSVAFAGCSGLAAVTIPDSVTQIGYHAFEDCTGLTAVTIPDSVTEIGSGAFQDCSGLTAVTIPDGMTKIEDDLFDGCSGLVSVTIPAGVAEIGYHAFKDCTALRDVTVLGRSTAIHPEAFLNCRSLNRITGTGGDVPERNREFAVQRNTKRFGIIFALLMLANAAGAGLIIYANLGYYHFLSSRHRYSKPAVLIGIVLCLGTLTAAWWSLTSDQIDPKFITKQAVHVPLGFGSLAAMAVLFYGIRQLFRKTKRPVPVRNVISEKDEQDVLDAFADVFTRIRSWCDELSAALEDAVRREGGQLRLTRRYVGKLAPRVLQNARLSRLTGIDPIYLNNSVSGYNLIGPVGGPGRIRLMIAGLAEGADMAVRMFRSFDPETKDKALRGMVLFYDDLMNEQVGQASTPESNADQIALCMSHYLDVLPVRIYFMLNNFRIQQGFSFWSRINLGEETQKILRHD